MAFGVEAVMPTEFLVPSLRIQVEHKLKEKQSEQTVEVAMAAAMVVIWPLGIETESEMEKALNLGEKSMQ